MTEDELTAIEARAKDALFRGKLLKPIFDDSTALVAECRRLRSGIHQACQSAWECDHHRFRGTDDRKDFYVVLCATLGYDPVTDDPVTDQDTGADE